MTDLSSETDFGQGDLCNNEQGLTRGKRFVLTIWEETILEKLKSDKQIRFGISGKETCPETGKTHWQTYVELKTERMLRTMWSYYEKTYCRLATKPCEANIRYCIKSGEVVWEVGAPIGRNGGAREGAGRPRREKPEGVRESLKDKVLKKYENVVWKDWQKEILEMIEKDPDERSIHWYWEPTGNIGKSFLSKYIACKYNGVIICDGKKDNIFNQVNMMMENGVEPRIVIMDVPRTIEGKIHMGTVEALKNGMMYSGKYEGGQCIFECPHVICLANFLPPVEDLSMDRWNIKDLSVNQNSVFEGTEVVGKVEELL